MAYIRVNINLPDIKASFPDYNKPAYKAANIKMIQKINSTYGQNFEFWGQVFEIPKGVIIAFIAAESGGVMASPNACCNATGLMQVTPIAAFTVRDWRKEVKTPLPSAALQEISKLKGLLNGTFSQSSLLQLLKTDSSFNIMLGTLILRWNLERFSTIFTGGQLNKAMIAYNAGAYTKALVIGSSTSNKIPIDSTTLANNPKVPIESRAYLLKMLGIDGFLNIIYKDKIII
jgi:hypothetical protein